MSKKYTIRIALEIVLIYLMEGRKTKDRQEENEPGQRKFKFNLYSPVNTFHIMDLKGWCGEESQRSRTKCSLLEIQKVRLEYQNQWGCSTRTSEAGVPGPRNSYFDCAPRNFDAGDPGTTLGETLLLDTWGETYSGLFKTAFIRTLQISIISYPTDPGK